jgi:hypothetical protein
MHAVFSLQKNIMAMARRTNLSIHLLGYIWLWATHDSTRTVLTKAYDTQPTGVEAHITRTTFAERKEAISLAREQLARRTAAVDERQALMILFESIQGRNWTTKSNWGTDRPLSEWCGATLDKKNRVVKLKLYGNRLSGTYPAYIQICAP